MNLLRMARFSLALIAPFLLASCIFQPGKFTSTLTVNADRSFSFTYKGEIIDADLTKSLPSENDIATPAECESDADKSAKCAKARAQAKIDAKTEHDNKLAEEETKYKAMAETLSKEAGYRSVAYIGNRKFLVDYEIKGTLDHTFIFPFNSDAQVIFPFMMIEPRQDGSVRITAPGYAAQQSNSAPGGGGENKDLDGTFTLDTNAEIASNNSEEGAKPASSLMRPGRSVIVWRVTPLTKDAPAATLRLGK
jgi:hypothetical protein